MLGVLVVAAQAALSIALDRRARATPGPRRLLTTRRHVAAYLAGNLSDIPPLPMRDFENVEYVSNVAIGTPPQIFSLVMDTGSSNLWVSSTACNTVGCSMMNKFDATKSGSYRATSTPFSLQYGTGSCSGNLAFDRVGFPGDSSYITNQEWGLASTVADFFAQAPLVDGIFGLGLDALAVDTVPTPLTNMKAQGLVSQRVLGIYLASRNATNSRLDFGFVDSAKYTGTLTYTPIVKTLGLSYLYYMINFAGMRVGSQQFNGCLFGLICEAVVDTGTSLIVGPSTVADPIIAALNVKPDCSNVKDLQDFCITIGATEFCIPPSVYVLQDGGQCQVGISSISPVEAQFWIFGDTFLRTVYAVIDVDRMQAGFAPQAALPPASNL